MFRQSDLKTSIFNMSKDNKDLSVREKRLQMDLDKEVKDFVLKLTKQHKNKSRHRLKLRRSISNRYVGDSTTGLPESTYLSRLISSPFLPHLRRPKTVSEARKLPKPPKRRSVSAGNRACGSLEVRSSTVKTVQHFPADRAQLRTPPSQWALPAPAHMNHPLLPRRLLYIPGHQQDLAIRKLQNSAVARILLQQSLDMILIEPKVIRNLLEKALLSLLYE